MSRVRLVRTGATVYFVAFLIFVIWPGFVPFNHPLPLVLGLPFNMAVIALWVAVGSLVLLVLDRSEQRHRAEMRSQSESGSGRASAPGRKW